MAAQAKYYIVEASALPKIFHKVVETTFNLQTGKAATVGEAVRQTGISRSAYYKYRDSIKPFFDRSSINMVTFLFVLEDQPGVLSGILNEFADSSYNILTINQSIPINGVASVTISAQAHDTTADAELLLENIRTLKGVSKAEIIAGER
ncbi:MAG: ACT domain-containing protein [Clostridiales bacterium]|nr:ACT domain-containing protein [Clostridiales bacterium]